MCMRQAKIATAKIAAERAVREVLPLGADLRIDSRPGAGTRLELAVPLGHKRLRKARASS